MSRLSKEEIESRMPPIHEFIQSLGFTLKPDGREFKILCPFHDDHNPSCCIIPSKKMFHCFVCGVGGDVFTFVEQYYNLSSFRDVLDHIAKHIGVMGGEKPQPAPMVRETIPPPQAIPMSPGEVLAVYRRYQAAAVDPHEAMGTLYLHDTLEPAIEAMNMLGAVVAPYNPGYKSRNAGSLVLVVPQRNHVGVLTSLRFRSFETKKRWSLDTKEVRDGQLVQTKASIAGLMATTAFFQGLTENQKHTVVIEGETDLIAGMAMAQLEWGQPENWKARFVGLPGVNSLHDELLKCDLNYVILFFDGDMAARFAMFDHRPQKRGPDGKMVPNIDAPIRPGLLRRVRENGTFAICAAPPQRDTKVDLRDLVNEGWLWERFFEHAITHGTANPNWRY